jgi:hypothetical protein
MPIGAAVAMGDGRRVCAYVTACGIAVLGLDAI